MGLGSFNLAQSGVNTTLNEVGCSGPQKNYFELRKRSRLISGTNNGICRWWSPIAFLSLVVRNYFMIQICQHLFHIFTGRERRNVLPYFHSATQLSTAGCVLTTYSRKWLKRTSGEKLFGSGLAWKSADFSAGESPPAAEEISRNQPQLDMPRQLSRTDELLVGLDRRAK